MKLRSYHILLALAFPSTVLACYSPENSDGLKRAIARASEPVVMGANCAFVNAGLDDMTSGGPAVPVGNARFYQVIDNGIPVSNLPSAIVVDCEEKAMTLIAAEPKGTDHLHSSCGLYANEFHDFLPPTGPLDLTEGHDLAAFEQIAKAMPEMRIDPDVAALVGPDEWQGGIPYPPKDHVDFLCGCRVHYPDSPGARS